MEDDLLEEYYARFARPGDDEEEWGWIIRLMEDWEAVARDLSHEAQNELLWKIIGADALGLGYGLGTELGPDAPTQRAILQAARHVTLAIPHLFGPNEPMENGYFMWWDLLAQHIAEREVADTCLAILDDLCRHSDPRVQAAALHGLGHLRHPDRPQVVDEFIRRHPELAHDSWVIQCREGTVM